MIGRYLALLLVLVPAATAFADSFCAQRSHCCDEECFVDCTTRPGATPNCANAHKFDHKGRSGDFCVLGGCVQTQVGAGGATCTPVVADGKTTTCTETVRSCGAITGTALCTSPTAPDPTSTNNQCVVTDPVSMKTQAFPASNPDFCPKFACVGGRIDNTDQDGDGLLDCWETEHGIDVNGDGVIDLPLPATLNPRRRDVIVEVDYFDCVAIGADCTFPHSHRPSANAINAVVAAFARDLRPNVDPTIVGTNLIVQVDEALIHQQNCAMDNSCFANFKATNLGTVLERANPLAIQAKRMVAHYSLWIHDQGPTDRRSGAGNEPGANFVVSLGTGWPQTDEIQAGTFMHELGHNLGLGHGGSDEVGNKPNYFSVMNYLFQKTGVTSLQPVAMGMPIPNTLPDYSFQAFANFDELAVNEAPGLNARAPSGDPFKMIFQCPNGKTSMAPADGTGVNFDCVDPPVPTAVNLKLDLNGDRVCVLPGPNRVLDTRIAAASDDFKARGLIMPGNDGILDPTMVIDPADFLGVGDERIWPGPDGILDTVAVAGSDDFKNPSTNTIEAGGDGLLQTVVPANDDVMNCKGPATRGAAACPDRTPGVPWPEPRVVAPTGNVLHTIALASDVIWDQEIWDGQSRAVGDGICQTQNIGDDTPSVVRDGVAKTTVLNVQEAQQLNGFDDWSNTKLDFSRNLKGFEAGPGVKTEMTREMVEANQRQTSMSDLSVTHQSRMNPDGTLTYVITVENHGPEQAIDASLNSKIQTPLSVVACSSKHGKCKMYGNTMVMDLGNLPRTRSTTVELTVKLNNKAIADGLVVSSVNARSSDPKLGNNVASTNQLLSTTSLVPVADNALRQATPAANDGTGSSMSVSTVAGRQETAVLRFDPAAIASAVGSRSLYSAKLVMTELNFHTGWNGGEIGAHRMTRSWTERSGSTGATWLCPADTNVLNSTNECPSGAWGMNAGDAAPLPFVSGATDTVKIYSDDYTTFVSLDVTADVRAFLSGTANNGWMLRAESGGVVGSRVDFSTRQGASAPTLVLEFGADLCPNNSAKVAPEQCGCDGADIDTDKDGVADCAEPFLVPSADSSLTKLLPNLNDGIGAMLGVATTKSSTGPERTLIRFDQAEIAALAAGKVVKQALLEMTVYWRPDGWVGGLIDLFPMSQAWDEGDGVGAGSTWACASDSNTTNTSYDCTSTRRWNMESSPMPFGSVPSATVGVYDMDAIVQFDVTADVLKFIAGTTNNGWIMIGRDGSGNPGWMYFASGETETPPRLRLTF